MHDPLDILGAASARQNAHRGRAAAAERAPGEIRQQLDVLGLHWPVSFDQVRARYKELAKRHHPDANGGDRAAEERLKTINIAYAAVRSHFVGEPNLATG